MRKLPIKKSDRQKLIIEATEDYFGHTNQKEKQSVRKIALWIMGRRKGLEKLTEDEREAIWYIKHNLADKEYRNSFETSKISS